MLDSLISIWIWLFKLEWNALSFTTIALHCCTSILQQSGWVEFWKKFWLWTKPVEFLCPALYSALYCTLYSALYWNPFSCNQGVSLLGRRGWRDPEGIKAMAIAPFLVINPVLVPAFPLFFLTLLAIFGVYGGRTQSFGFNQTTNLAIALRDRFKSSLSLTKFPPLPRQLLIPDLF